MKKGSIVIAILDTGFELLASFGPKQRKYEPANDLAGLPDEVKSTIRNSCFDCHSTQCNLPWNDKLTPVNYYVDNHDLKSHKVMDFSKWDSLAPQAQNGVLFYSLNKILDG